MATVRKITPRRRPPRLVALVDASATRRVRLFRALRKVVREHGFSDALVGAQFEATARPDTVPAMAATAVASASKCPPGQVTRIVCVRSEDGTVVCKPRCQPV
jgi:hypothetical protein